MKKHSRPVVRFCWDCGRRLHGRHHIIKKVHGEMRTLHESCGQKYLEDDTFDQPWEIWGDDFNWNKK